MPPKKPEETKVTKQFILDRLEENEVDLSMCGLTKVPVKELVRSCQAPSSVLTCLPVSLSLGTSSPRDAIRPLPKSLHHFAGT